MCSYSKCANTFNKCVFLHSTHLSIYVDSKLSILQIQFLVYKKIHINVHPNNVSICILYRYVNLSTTQMYISVHHTDVYICPLYKCVNGSILQICPMSILQMSLFFDSILKLCPSDHQTNVYIHLSYKNVHLSVLQKFQSAHHKNVSNCPN